MHKEYVEGKEDLYYYIYQNKGKRTQYIRVMDKKLYFSELEWDPFIEPSTTFSSCHTYFAKSICKVYIFYVITISYFLQSFIAHVYV